MTENDCKIEVSLTSPKFQKTGKAKHNRNLENILEKYKWHIKQTISLSIENEIQWHWSFQKVINPGQSAQQCFNMPYAAAQWLGHSQCLPSDTPEFLLTEVYIPSSLLDTWVVEASWAALPGP